MEGDTKQTRIRRPTTKQLGDGRRIQGSLEKSGEVWKSLRKKLSVDATDQAFPDFSRHPGTFPDLRNVSVQG